MVIVLAECVILWAANSLFLAGRASPLATMPAISSRATAAQNFMSD